MKIVIVITMIIITMTILSFEEQTKNMVKSHEQYVVYDRSFIGTMNNISKATHGDLMTSAFYPYIAYFTGRFSMGPYDIKSETELVTIMEKNNYTYLLVFENRSDEEKLKPLFSNKIKDLDKYFQRVGNYSTDFYQIRLYKLRT